MNRVSHESKSIYKLCNVGFEVLTRWWQWRITVCWDVTACSMVEVGKIIRRHSPEDSMLVALYYNVIQFLLCFVTDSAFTSSPVFSVVDMLRSRYRQLNRQLVCCCKCAVKIWLGYASVVVAALRQNMQKCAGIDHTCLLPFYNYWNCCGELVSKSLLGRLGAVNLLL
jgi:hypothetical protein